MQRYMAEADVNDFKRTDLIEIEGPLSDEMDDLVKGGYLRKVTADEAEEAKTAGSRVRGADDPEPETVGGVAASAVTEPATAEGDSTPAPAKGTAKRQR